jgi:hypothetical protein
MAHVVMCLSVAAAADDGEEKQVEHEASGKHEFHRNHIAFFVGSTATEDERPGGTDDPRFTLGVNYERRLTRLLGLGAVLEAVPEGEREAVVLVPVLFHVGRRAKFLIGPGAQRLEHPRETTFVARIGFEYDFHVKRVILTPELNFDFSEEADFSVLGLNIGWGF